MERRRYQMHIDGAWVDSLNGDTFESRSPATGEILAEMPKGTREDARRAITAAKAHQHEIANMPPFERARLCHRIANRIEERREEMARVLTLDQGKPYYTEAQIEVEECAEYFRCAAEDIKRLETSVIPSGDACKRVITIRPPRGVYAVISPWNWPLTMPAEFLAPGLAAGNAIVWSPASTTSLVALKLAECIIEAGVPKGVFNLVTGPGAVVGDEMAGHPNTDAVAFVGSTEVGRHVARRGAGKPMLLELGGNGPIIIFNDADLDKAVVGTVLGCFLCAGQSCTAGERILVHQAIHDEFVERLLKATKSIVLGDPFDKKTTMGPLNNEDVARKMDLHIEDALNKGARLLCGGRRPAGFPTDLYYEPTLLDRVSTEMLISQEETFGPIAPIMTFNSDENALALANGSEYGLLSSVYTRDLSRAFCFAERLQTGWVNINESSNYWETHLPFGGRSGKSSGMGRVGGKYALLEMTDLKTVVIDVTRSDE
jgi:succinate-semialdehyde dehydrogenase/glutarate-semialdehyde dehydrogenase